MVPLNSGPSLSDVRSQLGTILATEDSEPDHLRAFAIWLRGKPADLDGLATEAFTSLASSNRSSTDVATLGYVSATLEAGSGSRAAVSEGLSWLAERPWFTPQRPLTLEADGVSTLGIALAAVAVGRADTADWLRRLVFRSIDLPDLPDTERSLFLGAAEVLGHSGKIGLGASSPVARIALFSRGIGPVPTQPEKLEAWTRVSCFAGEDFVEAALALAALNALTAISLPARLGSVEPADVVKLLEGVKRSLRRWAWDEVPRTLNSRLARWDISNEYHVQDMLWAMLAPIFPDLSSEESLPPIGQKNPRIDLGIASLATIVEVKFVRPTTSFQSIIGEIAEDASLYRTDSRWHHLVPFIWDDSCRTEEHAILVQGLCRLEMVVGAVVVSRPGKMRLNKSEENSPAKKGRRTPKGSAAQTS